MVASSGIALGSRRWGKEGNSKIHEIVFSEDEKVSSGSARLFNEKKDLE